MSIVQISLSLLGGICVLLACVGATAGAADNGSAHGHVIKLLERIDDVVDKLGTIESNANLVRDGVQTASSISSKMETALDELEQRQSADRKEDLSTLKELDRLRERISRMKDREAVGDQDDQHSQDEHSELMRVVGELFSDKIEEDKQDHVAQNYQEMFWTIKATSVVLSIAMLCWVGTAENWRIHKFLRSTWTTVTGAEGEPLDSSPLPRSIGHHRSMKRRDGHVPAMVTMGDGRQRQRHPGEGGEGDHGPPEPFGQRELSGPSGKASGRAERGSLWGLVGKRKGNINRISSDSLEVPFNPQSPPPAADGGATVATVPQVRGSTGGTGTGRSAWDLIAQSQGQSRGHRADPLSLAEHQHHASFAAADTTGFMYGEDKRMTPRKKYRGKGGGSRSGVDEQRSKSLRRGLLRRWGNCDQLRGGSTASCSNT